MSINVRPVKRIVEEQKKKDNEVKLSDKASQLLERISKMNSSEKLFELEDEIAAKMTHGTITDQFAEDCIILRQAVDDYMNGKPITGNIIARVARLRRNTRLAHYATAQMRKEVADRMDNVDAKLLQLQNVTSEVQHIQKEIDRCLDFSAGDEDLELVPVEQFYGEAPESLTRSDETMGDEHEQYLSRLKFENDQRRDLLSNLNELEGRRNVLQSDIRGKEQRLQGLKPKLEDLAKVAEPVFDIVGAKFKDFAADSEQRKLSLALPAPLVVAHIHATAYKEIHDDKLFEFRIVDSSEATKLPKEDAEVKRRRKEDETTQEKINENAARILDVHPMSLELDIQCPNDGLKVTMIIQYLTELKVTSVKWNIHADSKYKRSHLFSADSFMSDLFEDDSGENCPNAVGDLKLESLKLNLFTNCNHIGKPYRFVQKLGGADGETDRIGITEHLRKVVKTIRTRISNRFVLDSIVRDMESKKPNGLSLEPDVKIISFKQCEDEAFIAAIPTSLSEKISKSSISERFSYKIEATDGNNKKLTTFISIPADYPRHTALFGICAAEDSNAVVVKEIEDRLNTEADYIDDVNSLKEQLSFLLKHVDLS